MYRKDNKSQTTVIKSLIWKMSERVLLQGLAMVVQIILARLLMPADFAAIALINAIINYLGLFVQSGLSTAVVQKKNLDEKDLSTLMTYSLSVALLIYVGIYVVAPLLSDYYNVGDIVWPIRVTSLSLFLYSFNSIQTGILSRHMQFRTIFFRSVIAMPIAAVIAIIMAYCGMGIWALISNTMFNILITVIIMNMIPELRVKIDFSWSRFKQLFSFSGKILLTNIVSGGGDVIRTMTIGKAYNSVQLAFYDRAYYYSNLVTQTVNASIQTVLLSFFSHSQDSIEQIKNMARRSVGMSSFVMIPVLTIVAVTANSLILILLTEKWLPCAPYLSLFCMLRIPCIITSIDKQVYYALGKSQIGFYYEIFLLAINILSLILMIPYGVFYIAIGYIVTEYIGNFVLCLVSSKVYRYSLRERARDIMRPILNSLIMAGGAYFLTLLNLNSWVLLFLQFVVALVIYTFMVQITNDPNWVYLIRKMKTRRYNNNNC